MQMRRLVASGVLGGLGLAGLGLAAGGTLASAAPAPAATPRGSCLLGLVCAPGSTPSTAPAAATPSANPAGLVGGLLATVGGTASQVVTGVGNTASQLVTGVGSTVAGVTDGVGAAVPAVGAVTGTVGKTVTGLTGTVGKTVTGVTGSVGTVVGGVTDTAGRIANSLTGTVTGALPLTAGTSGQLTRVDPLTQLPDLTTSQGDTTPGASTGATRNAPTLGVGGGVLTGASAGTDTAVLAAARRAGVTAPILTPLDLTRPEIGPGLAAAAVGALSLVGAGNLWAWRRLRPAR